MPPSFVHLRLHSEFSLVDGIVKIKPLVKRLTELNMPAVAITEQGNLFSLVKFYKTTLAAGIKAITGSDVYIFNPEEPSNPHHLTLLVNNKVGYVSLTELISKAYQEGQYQGIPILKPEWLEENHAGLIALSGAMQGEIGRALIAGKPALAVEKAQKWAAVFKDSFYLEIQRVGKLDEERYIHAAIQLAIDLDLPVVATNDVRFLDKKDFAAHEVRVCINQGRVLDDSRRPKNYTEQQYLRSSEEMQALFADIPEALANTVEIAKRCNLQLTLGENYLPDFPVPQGTTLDDYFRQASWQGLEERLKQHPPIGKGSFSENRIAYDQRLEIELNVICQMGFPGYFMIVADFIQWAKNHAIPVGPGRGSGAGSLVAYVLKITDLDPLEFDLLFERFLNPERVSMPDFDIDFCMDRRDEVIDYVAQRYGRNRVSQIITYGSMAAKAVIRDVGRVLNHGYGFVDRLAKLIPFEIGMTLDKALKDSSELRGLYETDDEVKNLINMALSLEGVVRNAGKHAGGVVISPTKLTDFTPLYCEEGGSNLVTQFDKNDVEAVGLVKFDFLGLRTLTIIDWALQTINRKQHALGLASVDIAQIPRDDAASYELLKNSQTTAVFQLESRGMKELIGRLKPDCFDDIIALVALYRPGPLESGMVDDYVKVKHGQQAAEYSHPLLIPILKPTNGVILYQEQVMQIAREMAGYTLGGADMLRRCLSGSTQVLDVATGQSVSLQEIANNIDYWLGRNLFSLDLATQKIVSKPITAIYSNGIRDVWEITTKTNRKIRATADHLFYTVLGWKPLAEFKLGDSIALTKHLPIAYESQFSNAQVKITAYLIGDGYLTTKAEKRVNSYFCNSDEKLINDFNDCCLELFGRKVPLSYQHHEGRKSVCYARINFNEFNQWIDHHIKRGCAKDKEIPTWVYQLSAKQLALFIGTLWSTDGSFDTSIGHTDYTSTSQILIRQLQHLLLRLGIVALFNIKIIQYKNKPHISYRVQITGREDVVKFYEVITPFLSVAKAEKSQLCYERIKVKLSNQSKHQLPIAVTYLIAEAKQVSGMTWAEIDAVMNMPRGSMSSGLNFKNPHRELSRHRVSYFSQSLNNERLKAIADSEVFWDKIVSIDHIGKEAVFDLTIPETHNFIANDFIAHNCMGKKDVKEMAQQRTSFVSGSIANQIDESIATYIFDLMEKFAGYGFNKSHSAAYALVAYQTAWLKAHYPAEFMAAVLSADMDNTDKIVILIEECKQMKLTICPPHLNLSEYQFTVNKAGQIIYGLGAIKGAGQAAIDDLLAERREKGAFSGLYDLCKRVVNRKVNRRVLESLIKAGAFDSLDNNPAKLFAQLPEALRVAEQFGKTVATGQNDFFGLIAETTDDQEPTFEAIAVEPWSQRERLEAEKLTLGLYLSGHPIDQYEQELKNFTSGKIADLVTQAEKTHGKMDVKIAGFVVDMKLQADKKRCFVMLDDRTERLEVAVFSEVYEKYRSMLSKDTLLVVDGTLEKNNFSGGLRMTAKKLYDIEQARAGFAKFLFFEWVYQDKNYSASEFMQNLREILIPFRGGSCPLVMRYTSATAFVNLNLGDEWRVNVTDELLLRLQRFSAITKVELKYK